MATYFTPVPRRERSVAREAPVTRDRPALDTSSILIFPSPPTAIGSSVPPSPYASSLSSVPTDLSFPSDSGLSLSRRASSRGRHSLSRASSSRGRSRSHTPSLVSSSWEDLWEEEEDDLALWHSAARGRDGGSLAFPSGDGARDRERYFELVIQPKLEARSRTISTRSSGSHARLPDPHPTVNLPLLDLFRRFISLDEETVQLLTRASTSHSELFPASPYDGASIAEVEEEARILEERTHAGKLVPRHETSVLQQGLEVTADLLPTNPFAVRFSLWTLISMVAGAVGTGGRVLSTSWRGPRQSD